MPSILLDWLFSLPLSGVFRLPSSRSDSFLFAHTTSFFRPPDYFSPFFFTLYYRIKATSSYIWTRNMCFPANAHSSNFLFINTSKEPKKKEYAPHHFYHHVRRSHWYCSGGSPRYWRWFRRRNDGLFRTLASTIYHVACILNGPVQVEVKNNKRLGFCLNSLAALRYSALCIGDIVPT